MPNDNYANEPNNSRAEFIIQSILDGTEYDEPAQSRIEYLLKELKRVIENWTKYGVNLIGETTTALADNSTTNPIIVDGQSYTAQSNDAVIYGHKEFLFDGTKWHEFGDLSGLSSKDIGAMTNYVKAVTTADIDPTDTLNQAIGKLEKRVSDNETNILNCVKVYPNIIGPGVNCNANSVEDNTLYRLQTDNVTNFPTGYPTAGAIHYIITIENTYGQGIQRYQYIFNNDMTVKWKRSQNQGNWTAWGNVLSAGTIECGSGKQYTRLRDAVAAGVLNGRTVIVYPGTYDLTSEFASELAAETGSAGIALGNGVHIIFMAGAYVTAELDGSSDWAYDNFQPFYSTGSFTLENVHIIASNTRYCVHNEHSNNSTPYTAKFINCHMEYTNSRQNVKYVQCIGGGLGLHGNILIDGGFYKSSTEYGYSTYGSYGTAQNCQQPISYHNSSLAGADSKIVIRNVYLADRGYFRFGNHGSSTILSNIEISGCSVGLPTMNMFETVDDVTMNLSFVLYNNTIRNNAVPFDFSRLIGLYED